MMCATLSSLSGYSPAGQITGLPSVAFTLSSQAVLSFSHRRHRFASTCRQDALRLRNSREPPCRPMYACTGSAQEVLRDKPRPAEVLNVYVFLTIVGWGKNILMEQVQALPLDDIAVHFGEARAPVVLESDAIGAKRFWPQVRRTIVNGDGAGLGGHLFLNKNFPPNSWPGARSKLEEYCSEAGRALRIHAIVPESAGESWNPFSLLDLAVCLLSVQTREGHANLGAESDATARIAAMFYSFYNMRGATRPARR